MGSKPRTTTSPALKMLDAVLERFEISSANEILVEEKGITVRVSRGGNVGAPVPMSVPVAEKVEAGESAENYHVVTSPFVGTFYRRPNPDADMYISEGDTVSVGTVLCIVEAMKLMNEIEADAPGKIVKILVKDQDHVEYGQPLFHIE